ncbi:hypothetical protein CH369_08565 [Leptospira levettii]|uniref:DUF1574 domain-containing protein n=1 Tax=Leptospira levettii TaxID=2023178 RepID=UPI000C2ADB98|nr:DUF1574 domain-containing protein [Leptospira levettii]MCW7472644.1 DUF1574 domain-containing protein [Leptospira levettii]PJZ87559.1 hypothetical protein CH368_16295 [Leptospira levettii]PKA00516.1 hypothetical protein CH369_08565 [Leptospira levettii]
MKSKPFLFYPVVLFLFIFVIDKIFLLPIFHDEFLQAGNSVFYFQRKVLKDRLLKDPDLKEKKLTLVFGDSRSYPFSEIGIPEPYKKNWTLYNFSSPQGIPMNSYIQFQEILESGVTPDFVILSLSPEAFDDSKGFILSPFLRMGCDSNCIETVWEDVPFKEKWDYLLDRVFAIRSIEFNLSLFTSRLKQGKLKEYKSSHNKEFQLINYTKGEYLMYGVQSNPIEKIKNDTIRIGNLYMRSYSIGSSQFPYVEKILKITKEKKIKTLVLWPKVFPDYYSYYEKFHIKEVWWNKVETLAKKYDVNTLNWNTPNTCDLFNDASHQSAFCFVDQMKEIWINTAEK